MILKATVGGGEGDGGEGDGGEGDGGGGLGGDGGDGGDLQMHWIPEPVPS